MKDTKEVIVIRKDLNMRKGKITAQASHASMAFLTQGGSVVHVEDDECDFADENGMGCVEVYQNGNDFVRIS
jgi:peptidyl-tRNA hydrolase